MRIALAHLRHAHAGGTERYLNELASFLANRGHDVTIVCRRHESAPHPSVRFTVLRSPALGKTWRMLAFARALDRHVLQAGYDLVFGLGKTWTHDVVRLGGGSHATYLELLGRGKPSGVVRELGQLGSRLNPKNLLALSIERRALRRGAYRKVIANSHMVRRDVIARYGIPEGDVATIHNGVDLERFHPARRAQEGARLRAELGFLPEELVVLFLGSGYARKGLDLVLGAFPALLASEARARLVVAGYDSSWKRYARRAKNAGLGAQARFLGGRRDPETLYAAADLFVLPTRYDPFANATLEALASGLPVITSTSNGGAELLTNRREGSVIDVAEGEQALARELLHWADPARRAAGAVATRALAERHAIASKLLETERLLEQVLEEKRRSGRLGAGPVHAIETASRSR